MGGLVRQFGNLSYSRVFQAGHEVPSWQPETALAIFERALGNRDIATGTKDTSRQQYSSVGSGDTWGAKSEIPDAELWFCYTLVPETCTEEQLAAVQNGSAKISRYVVEDANSTVLFPELFEQESMLDPGQQHRGGNGGNGRPEEQESIAEPTVEVDLFHVGMLQLVLSDTTT